MFKNEHSSGTETIIGPSVHVQGDLASQGDIRIEGAVTGTVTTSGNLSVGEQAQITANVEAANAYIAGQIKGNLNIHEKLELAPTSQIAGDLTTKILVMAEGARLDGRCQMSAGANPSSASPRSKKASSPENA